jgi:hypothetical protein
MLTPSRRRYSVKRFRRLLAAILVGKDRNASSVKRSSAVQLLRLLDLKDLQVCPGFGHLSIQITHLIDQRESARL